MKIDANGIRDKTFGGTSNDYAESVVSLRVMGVSTGWVFSRQITEFAGKLCTMEIKYGIKPLEQWK